MNPTTGSVFTAIIEREGNLYVALCPELDENLTDAVALFIETIDPREMKERRREHVFVTQFQAADGPASSPGARPARYSSNTAAGDDAKAIELSSRLIREIGYEPVLIGGLAMGKHLIPGTPLAGERTPDQVRQIAATLK